MFENNFTFGTTSMKHTMTTSITKYKHLLGTTALRTRTKNYPGITMYKLYRNMYKPNVIIHEIKKIYVRSDHHILLKDAKQIAFMLLFMLVN